MMRPVRYLLTAFMVTMTALPALAEIRQLRIEVSGLYCPSCPFTVAQSLKAVPSVRIVGGKYDEDNQIAVYELEFDDSKTSVNDILAAPEDYGYESRLLDDGAS